MRLVVILAVVVALMGSIGVRAQETTPVDYSGWIQGYAERSWFDLDRPPTSGWGFLQSSVYRFDSPTHAQTAIRDVISQTLVRFRLEANAEPAVRRVAAPAVGDISSAWVNDPPGVDGSDVAFGFVDDEFIIILAAAALTDESTSATITDLTFIAGQVVGRRPVNESPSFDGDITIGGLFDLLPGYQDVRIGLSIASESGALPQEP